MGWTSVARQTDSVGGLDPFVFGDGSNWRSTYVANEVAEIPEFSGLDDDAPVQSIAQMDYAAQTELSGFDALRAISSLARLQLEPLVIRRSDPWGALRTLMESWRQLPDGWGDEDSLRPTGQVLTCAGLFIARAARARVVPPQPFITDDGEIGFRWRKDDGFASICFLPNEEVTLFCRTPGGRRAFDVHMVGFPDDLLAPFFTELRHFGE